MITRTITIIFALAMLLAQSACAAEYPDPKLWDATIRGFALEDEIIGPQHGAIVATGSSSMRFWDNRIEEDLAPLTIISRGFGGSNMNDVLHHLDTLVLNHKPRAVLLYEGDNDVAQGVDTDTIIATFTRAFERIHAQDDAVRIYVLSAKPSIARLAMWPAMVAVNERLAKLANADERITYIDVATPMLNADGTPNEALFVSDMLHMNQRGYDIWRDTVAPILRAGELSHE
ncbi:MAG: GDSL-type esterase/lipase family protein [Pseudomonadaceae bacterium]|nr:GDSL-type esterase/lipase family protein [Pseudomonadaceae bacterium]